MPDVIVPPSAPALVTIPSIIEAAEQTLDPYLWDFLSGGTETEHTLRANREALDALHFCPRVLVNVQQVDPSVTLLGYRMRTPVFLAPMGSITRFHPEGALAVARVAARTGSVCFVSANVAQSLAEIKAEVPDVALVFQAYGYDDREILAALARRAEETGCLALCLTVDGPVESRRERDLRHGFRHREKPGRPNIDDIPGSRSQESRAGFTWAELAWLRERTRLPLILKGVQHPADAKLAVEHGIDAVYVSNHGGRQLDYVPGAVALLPRIVEAVAGRAEILVDGGFQRGTDVLKGLALGATAVGIGKLQGWALAAAGEPGLDRLMALLEEEIRCSMGLLGVPTVGDLTPDFIEAVDPR